MINYLIAKKLETFEKTTGESVDCMRDLLRQSRQGFFLFMLFVPLTKYRGALSKEDFHVARITTMKHEDCGPCLQTTVTLALLDGVDVGLVQKVIARNIPSLPLSIQSVIAFTEAVLARTEDLDTRRDEVVLRLGERAPADLGVAIAAVRVYPVLKRAMGYAKSCSLIKLSLPVPYPPAD